MFVRTWHSCSPRCSLEVPSDTPVIADKGHDSDGLRDTLVMEGFELIISHRKNRTKLSRNDGRRLRLYRHRWLVERTNTWLRCIGAWQYNGPTTFHVCRFGVCRVHSHGSQKV